MSALQTEIEDRLRSAEPDVEVLLAEVVSGGTLRLFIDHPEGVTLGLCERVTTHLAPLRERYAIEVSSPGADRPLTRPVHYRRFLGRRVKVRVAGAAGSPSSVIGELVGATDRDVTVAAPDGVVTVPFADIVRSNLVPGV